VILAIFANVVATIITLGLLAALFAVWAWCMMKIAVGIRQTARRFSSEA
jgi:uncharacterized membrane protein YjgN (DUF898 family)